MCSWIFQFTEDEGIDWYQTDSSETTRTREVELTTILLLTKDQTGSGIQTVIDSYTRQ